MGALDLTAARETNVVVSPKRNSNDFQLCQLKLVTFLLL